MKNNDNRKITSPWTMKFMKKRRRKPLNRSRSHERISFKQTPSFDIKTFREKHCYFESKFAFDLIAKSTRIASKFVVKTFHEKQDHRKITSPWTMKFMKKRPRKPQNRSHSQEIHFQKLATLTWKFSWKTLLLWQKNRTRSDCKKYTQRNC